MARFLAVLLAAVALLAISPRAQAARTGHAAPSTTELIWRAVLRRLRTDTSVLMAGVTNGAGRSTSGLDYDDYTRLPPTAGKAEPYNHAYQAPSEGRDVREDDVPSNYSYDAPGGEGSDGKDDVPFDYNYKAPGEGSDARDDVPSNYSYDAPGGEANKAGDEGDDVPFGYDYKEPRKLVTGRGATAPRARGGRQKATTTAFFHEETVRVGGRLHFRFPAAAPAPLGLLPRHAADSIPFTKRALPEILAMFRVSPGSAQAAAMAETLRKCDWPPLAGESKFCASSLEALVERAMAMLGTRDVRAVTSTLPRDGAPLQPYTVRAVRRVDGESFVACHDEVFPYTVYRCHTTGPARAYMMEMEGAGGATITVATVCHTDTSLWNPEHLSFKILGTKPGGAPICHFMPYGHIIWAKNVKRSPA